MSKGRLITFEGIEGSGKSTQIERLSTFLRAQKKEVLTLREPGGTALGETLRNLLQHQTDIDIHRQAEWLLFSASRVQLIHEVILPALNRGVWVLCDRFIDSTIAYQGYGRELDIPAMKQLHKSILGALAPDITFFLSVDVNQGFKRVEARCKEQAVEPDRMESQQRDFYERVFVGYDELAKDEKRIHRIDGTAPIEEISEYIQQEVLALLSGTTT